MYDKTNKKSSSNRSTVSEILLAVISADPEIFDNLYHKLRQFGLQRHALKILPDSAEVAAAWNERMGKNDFDFMPETSEIGLFSRFR